MLYFELNISRHYRYVKSVKDFIQETIKPEQIIADGPYNGGLSNIGGELFWFVKDGVTVKYDWQEECDLNNPNGTHSISTEDKSEVSILLVRKIAEKIIYHFKETDKKDAQPDG
ncbi:hypothetical protein [Cohnella yongneupensis]|uniref:Uncharacterized protein n=1 Tax=Cohnella yongneupensis TaxID=425006 RepID=A0ABW0QW27_9BACL